MNYYGARRRKSEARFDFTCMNDGRVWPVGYCCGWDSLERKSPVAYINEMMVEELARLAPFKHRYHTDGHATEEDAQACYRRYLLDTRTRFETQEHSQRKCEAFTDPSHATKCGKWTQGLVFVEDWFACLCDEHRTAAVVSELFPEVGTIMSS